MQNKLFDTYEEWDLTLPRVPQRSVLFSLEPVGVGTAWVESLTSYIARLASAHAVFAGVLMNKVIAPLVRDSHAQTLVISHGQKTNLLNATGLLASSAVQLLESLTMRQDLRYLTLLVWSDVLGSRGLVRATRAWCPHCYQQWQDTGKILFDPLLWAIREVTVCVVHHMALCERCPNPKCKQTLPALCWRSRPGYCSYCQQWLGVGTTRDENMTETMQLRHQWVTKNLGALLAASPTVSVSPSRIRLSEVLPPIIQQVTQGNISAFARILHLSQGLVSRWVNGSKLPLLEMLLHICSVVDLSLEDLFLKDPASLHPRLRTADEPEMYVSRRRRTPAQASEVCLALEDILATNEDPPPSLTQVAQRLGLGLSVLERCHPMAYRTIAARHKEYGHQRAVRRLQKYREDLREVARLLYERGLSLTKGRIQALLPQPGLLRDPRVRQLLVEVRREIEGQKDEKLSEEFSTILKIDQKGQSF